MDKELTENEKMLLNDIIVLTDDFGEEDEFIYENLKEGGYDMKIARGVIGSLVKKGYIFFDEDYVGSKVLRRYIYINHTI